MTKKELIEALSEAEDNAEITVQILDDEGDYQQHSFVIETDEDHVWIELPDGVITYS